ncbi:hypothetical protein RI129_003744 [Pyrocoelia pectoralis]|uniref:Protein NEDD1 n=1 Tax=Pyrocoelia pectoralis TaxID=417401 RepID=A0AAN7VIG0_9COLE
MSIIATASDDIKFHDWPEGNLKLYYRPANSVDGHVKTISWGRDGNWLVVVPHAGPAEVISIKGNVKVLQTIHNIYHPTCAAFHNNTKKSIVIGTLSGQVLVYDIKAQNIKKRFPRAPSTIFDVQYNSKDSHVAAACTNGDIFLYNYLTTNLSSLYKVPKSESVSAINFHRTKRNFFTAGSEEGVVAVWDINTNQIFCDVQAHHAPVTGLTFSPIRYDLVVTSGLDRRVAFYDLAAKKCVIELEVTSCTTALDYSPCGTYLGLGSQNGSIIVYDTRNFRKPISAFVAHADKRIRHLFFQKVLFSGTESEQGSFDIVPEEPIVTTSDARSVGDSLGLIMCDDSNVQDDSQKIPQDVGDSFLVALGLNNSSHMSEIKEISGELGTPEDSRKKNDGTRRFSYQSNQLAENVTALKTPGNTGRQISSTPKYLPDHLPITTESPIVSSHICHGNCGSSVSDFKQLIRDIIKEENQTLVENFTKDIESQVEDFKKEITWEVSDALGHIRRHLLDLQMSIVKQFVDMESKMDTITNTPIREFVCDEFLIRRNDELLKEVESLRAQLMEKNQLRRKF